MTEHDDRPQPNAAAEWEMDQLVALVALRRARLPGAPEGADPRLLDHLARELRDRPPAPEDWTPAEVAAVRDRVRARVVAARAGVRCLDGPAPQRPAPAAPIAQALEAAAAAGYAPYPPVDLAVAAGAGRALWDGECESWVEVPPALAAGQYLALTIAGDSMEPLLHAGDVVLVQLGAPAAAGKVVVARVGEDGYVVKRVGTATRLWVELESLNSGYPPLKVRRDALAVLGVVVARWCAHGAAADDA